MEDRRNLFPRIGVTLLNFIGPGLGLLPLCRPRLALTFYGLCIVWFVWLTITPPLPFALLLLTYTAVLLVLGASIWLTWRYSRFQQREKPWYCRWYSVSAAAVLILIVSFNFTEPERFRFKPFYVPSEAMEPTLQKNERLFAYMEKMPALHRGDLILVGADGGDTYLKRVAGLPGDRIELRRGIVLVNGQSIPQRLIGLDRVDFRFGPPQARRLRERFPGEQLDHQIYDLGISIGDDFGPVLVQPGHLFVLGDNRDRSADSRFGSEDYGLGQVRIGDVVGRPLYYSWGGPHTFGSRIH